MTEGTPTPATPFAHLDAPNRDLYRAALRTFARARDRFIVHMRPEDVAADLGRPGDAEPVAEALNKLVHWGNLHRDPDTGRVTTVSDFHRARYLYQLTAEGQAAEAAIALYEDAIGRRGQLQSVALADIADQLRALVGLAADPDPAKLHLLMLGLADRFTGLADNAQAFMASLRRVIDFSDGDVTSFIAYKQRLIDYINRFIADLANRGAEIAALLSGIEDVDRLLTVVARREAADAGPDADQAAAVAAALDTWRNRWRGLHDWFISADSRHPSQARLLRGAAVTAITQLIDTVGVLNERRAGRSDRSADFRALARWFAEAHDDDARHRLWRAAFGLSPARHLSVTAATLASWQEDPPAPGTAWRDAPPVHVSPQLRRTGSYERRGRPSQVADRAEHRWVLKVRAEREAAEAAEARRRLATGPIRLSDLGTLDTNEFRLFLRLLGDALSARLPHETEVKTSTGDGTMQIRLSLVPDGVVVEIQTVDGVLRGPEHIVEIVDLTVQRERG
ncbi:TIGR02677 family protein [Actinokineospora sp. 24-640]